MRLLTPFARRNARLAIALALVAGAILGSAALVYADSPQHVPGAAQREVVLPVEPDGGIGEEVPANDEPLPVEPDGGIGGEVPSDPDTSVADDQPLPVEPDGGIGGEVPANDDPLPVEPDGGIGD